MISGSIHGVYELCSSKEFLRHSSFLVECAYGLRIARTSLQLQIWSFSGKGNATNADTRILCPSNFLGFCTLLRSQYWKCGLLIVSPLLLFSLSSRCRNRHTWRWEPRRKTFLYVCHPRIVVLILSSRWILAFSAIRLYPRMYCASENMSELIL